MAETTGHDERQLFIGGAWVEASRGTYEIVNPATEECVGLAANGGADDARAAVAAAKEAQPAWAAWSAEDRCALLRDAAAALRAKSAELLPLVMAETGSTAALGAHLQIPLAVDRLERSARDPRPVLETPLLPQPVESSPFSGGGVIGAMVNRVPLGVVACITAYNFPLSNVAGKIGPALAAGNTVVVKPAPQDPLAVMELVRILDGVGFPPGSVNLVNGEGPASSAALVDAGDVDAVSFTGSSTVGVAIAQAAARAMKRTLLELGGKGACVVFDDADVEAAITCLSSTWTIHSGQVCTAPTRGVVHRSVFDRVCGALVERASQLTVGDPTDPTTVVGPVISAAQRARVEAHVEGAWEDGGEILAGGARPSDPAVGYYVAPTLIAGDPTMRVAREEIFGPVLTVIPFDDEEEGVAIANGTAYGLYDRVYSADWSRALRVAKRLRSGSVSVNTSQRHYEAPFGGFKMSGIGRDGGDYGLLAYTEPQSIVWSV